MNYDHVLICERDGEYVLQHHWREGDTGGSRTIFRAPVVDNTIEERISLILKAREQLRQGGKNGNG